VRKPCLRASTSMCSIIRPASPRRWCSGRIAIAAAERTFASGASSSPANAPRKSPSKPAGSPSTVPSQLHGTVKPRPARSPESVSIVANCSSPKRSVRRGQSGDTTSPWTLYSGQTPCVTLSQRSSTSGTSAMGTMA
jgi:hypothetical protein